MDRIFASLKSYTYDAIERSEVVMSQWIVHEKYVKQRF